jgi:hypothetical protein
MPSSHSSPVASDDEAQSLSESFLFVSNESNLEDDRETSSTLGSSLRGSVIGIGDFLSDTSSEPEHGDHHWTTDDELDNLTSLGDSYADAEATSTELSGSKSTISRGPLHGYGYGFDSTSSSQVRLIMPDPAASFTSSGNGSTPSASLGNLLKLPDLARRGSGLGVDKSWLEASSRLWNISPELGILLHDGEGYGVLESREDDKAGWEDKVMLAGVKHEIPIIKAVVEAEQRELRTAITVGIRHLSKIWLVT